LPLELGHVEHELRVVVGDGFAGFAGFFGEPHPCRIGRMNMERPFHRRHLGCAADGNCIPGPERMLFDAGVVDEGAVAAFEVGDDPAIFGAFERKVPAGNALVGEAVVAPRIPPKHEGRTHQVNPSGFALVLAHQPGFRRPLSCGHQTLSLKTFP
jgi:hypothetical protein